MLGKFLLLKRQLSIWSKIWSNFLKTTNKQKSTMQMLIISQQPWLSIHLEKENMIHILDTPSRSHSYCFFFSLYSNDKCDTNLNCPLFYFISYIWFPKLQIVQCAYFNLVTNGNIVFILPFSHSTVYLATQLCGCIHLYLLHFVCCIINSLLLETIPI